MIPSMAQQRSTGSARRSGNPAVRAAAGEHAGARRAGWRDWVEGARPRTLPLAIAPVLIGSGAALVVDRSFHWAIALACLTVAVALQVGVNFANDYSDGVRGTDEFRVGPARLTGSRMASARTVLTVALAWFALAALAGLAIVIRTQQWWLLAVGAACIVAAWFYTGGKRPYGYAGLGEVFVFVFFGLVATLGTTWVQVFTLPQEAWLGAVAAGLFACAVLLANNLRDLDQDRSAGKRTLSVLIGRLGTQILFTVLVLVPFGISVFLALFYPVAWLTLLALLAAVPALVIVWFFREGRELVTALALTSVAALGYAALLFFAFAY